MSQVAKMMNVLWMAMRVRLAMRAAGTAGLGAGAEGLVNDGLDGARAPPALGAATEASIELLGASGEAF